MITMNETSEKVSLMITGDKFEVLKIISEKHGKSPGVLLQGIFNHQLKNTFRAELEDIGVKLPDVPTIKKDGKSLRESEEVDMLTKMNVVAVLEKNKFLDNL